MSTTNWIVGLAIVAFGVWFWWRSRPELEGPEAHALVDAGALLLDVRTPGEFSSGHIDGALNIPVAELGARLAEVPKDRPVVVYCASGGRSSSAAKMLAGQGYDARNLGAMGNW